MMVGLLRQSADGAGELLRGSEVGHAVARDHLAGQVPEVVGQAGGDLLAVEPLLVLRGNGHGSTTSPIGPGL